MGPGTGDCNNNGGGCSYTVNGTSAPDNAVAIGQGTVDKLRIQQNGVSSAVTGRNYNYPGLLLRRIRR